MSNKVSLLSEMINNEMNRKSSNNDRDYSYFHPSEFHQCSRLLAYRYVGEEAVQNITPQLQRIFDNGHYMHDRYGDYFEKAGILRGYWHCLHRDCETLIGRDDRYGIKRPDKCPKCSGTSFRYDEVFVEDENLFFKGRVDGILDLPDGFFVIDYKSIFSMQYKKLTKPLEKHYIQIMIYIMLLDIKAGFLLYENKDSQQIKIYEVERNEEFIDRVKSRALKLKEMLLNGDMPKRPSSYTKGGKPCKTCPFKKVCWK